MNSKPLSEMEKDKSHKADPNKNTMKRRHPSRGSKNRINEDPNENQYNTNTSDRDHLNTNSRSNSNVDLGQYNSRETHHTKDQREVTLGNQSKKSLNESNEKTNKNKTSNTDSHDTLRSKSSDVGKESPHGSK